MHDASRFYSAGLHPWFLTADTLDAAVNWLQAQAAHPQVLAIGECGLDKLTHTPWTLQLDAFQRCFALSESAQKPLVLHCVKAYAEIVALKKQWKPTQPWIIHGFDKNLPTALMLLKAGCYLSFGASLFRGNSHTAAVLGQIPADRFFLETDDATWTIETIYQQACAIRGISIEILSTRLNESFTKVFTL